MRAGEQAGRPGAGRRLDAGQSAAILINAWRIRDADWWHGVATENPNAARLSPDRNSSGAKDRDQHRASENPGRKARRTVEIVEFDTAHVAMIEAQFAQVSEVRAASTAAEYGKAWTATVNGKPIACAGLVEVWQGRAYAWGLLSKDCGPYLLSLTREIRSRLDGAGFARVEMAVDAGFGAGCRWAELLGFSLETPEPMQKFLPNSRPAYLYART